MSTSDALDEAEDWIGEGYKQIDTDMFASVDGMRTVRFDLDDVDVAPHLNLEKWNYSVFDKTIKNRRVTKNIHIFFLD